MHWDLAAYQIVSSFNSRHLLGGIMPMLHLKMASISPILCHQSKAISMAKMGPQHGITNCCVLQIGWLTLTLKISSD
jgi:hypothetical protein